MTLIIKSPVEGKLKEIQFVFNLELDDALAVVAKEMVMELGIPETGMPGIAKEAVDRGAGLDVMGAC